VVERSPYSLVDRRVERELLAMARSRGIGITVWSPLAARLLAGCLPANIVATAGKPAHSCPGSAPNAWVASHFTPQATQALDAIVALADESVARRLSCR
jgi:aryl-alcohol dehydrogenase-like predicted oxidoreductase